MKEAYDGFDSPIMFMSPTEAEAVKYLSNCLLLTKVAFSQEVAKLCSMLNLNAKVVYQGVTTDNRVHPAHLDPTMGRVSTHTPCLSKDLMALIVQMERSGYDPIMLKSVYATAIDGVRLEPTFKIKEEIK
jgi:UDPglucose 6-dehydrogenase